MTDSHGGMAGGKYGRRGHILWLTIWPVELRALYFCIDVNFSWSTVLVYEYFVVWAKSIQAKRTGTKLKYYK